MFRSRKKSSPFLFNFSDLDGEIDGCKQMQFHFHSPAHRLKWGFRSGLPEKLTIRSDRKAHVKYCRPKRRSTILHLWKVTSSMKIISIDVYFPLVKQTRGGDTLVSLQDLVSDVEWDYALAIRKKISPLARVLLFTGSLGQISRAWRTMQSAF